MAGLIAGTLLAGCNGGDGNGDEEMKYTDVEESERVLAVRIIRESDLNDSSSGTGQEKEGLQ